MRRCVGGHAARRVARAHKAFETLAAELRADADALGGRGITAVRVAFAGVICGEMRGLRCRIFRRFEGRRFGW